MTGKVTREIEICRAENQNKTFFQPLRQNRINYNVKFITLNKINLWHHTTNSRTFGHVLLGA